LWKETNLFLIGRLMLEEKKIHSKEELLRYEPFMRFDYPPSICEYIKVSSKKKSFKFSKDNFHSNFHFTMSSVEYVIFHVSFNHCIMLYKMYSTRFKYKKKKKLKQKKKSLFRVTRFLKTIL